MTFLHCKLPVPFLLIASSIAPISLVVGVSSIAVGSDRPAKPNVVLILTDDLGWQDVKCDDVDVPSPMETPNIDAFA